MANTGEADYGELLRYLLGTMGAQVGSGIKGISTLPQGADAAADAVRDYQQKYSPSDDLTTDGVRAVQNTIVPAAGVAHTLYGPQTILGSAGRSLMDKWQSMKDKAAEHSPLDATAMEILPAMMNPELGLGHAAGEVAGAVKPFARGSVPLLDDGATEATLLRERAANLRRQQDGLGQGEVPVSDFPGRSAMHEGVTAQRMREDGAPLETPPDAMAPNQYTNWIGKQAGDGSIPSFAGQGSDKISQVAQQYMASKGMEYNPPGLVKVDPERSARIAQAYDQMPHAPNDPKVAASYQAMINETMDQYQHAKAAGLKAEFIPPGSPDPYGNPRNAIADIHDNNHMWVYPTDSGFGSSDLDVSSNPLLAHSGESFNGQPARMNDIFRVVHDYFGHAKAGVGFRANGEENAWAQHAHMYSPEARPAMTSETRGQNSWVNFGPHAEANKTASGADTIYADQKTGLLPDEFSDPDNASAYAEGGSVIDTAAKLAAKYSHEVVDSHTGDVVGQYANKVTASRAVDRLDNQYGAYRYSHRPIANDTTTQAQGAPLPGEQGYAEGGEVEPLLGGIAHLAEKYAVPDHAAHLADTLATNGSVTYNPLSGDVHESGYLIPKPDASAAFDAPPTSDQIHQFLMQHEDKLQQPNTVLHGEVQPEGSYLHIARHEPDFQSAMMVAQGEGAPGVHELHTGHAFDAYPESEPTDPDAELVKNLPEVMGQHDPDANQRMKAPWRYGQQTVDQPQRNAFPGIYDDPRQVIARAGEKVAPEDPMMSRLFGVTRADLSEQALARQGNELGALPNASKNPGGAESARRVMTPQNEQRLIDVLSEARGTPLYTGMTGWYNMDPLYERFRQIYGDEEAPARYARFNTLSGMASPGSSVDQEIARGSAAHWLNEQGRFSDFMNYGDGKGRGPADTHDIPGHVYHSTAQAAPMADYLRTGEIQLQAPKVSNYIPASGVPDTGFQTSTPVGDAHWARGVGLADTRNMRSVKGQPTIPGQSVSTPELQQLAPWWRDRVAGQAGLDSVPAQALAWGAFSPTTGVKSLIGAPKLEILSGQIAKLSQRLGVSPEMARDMMIRGQAGAY